MNCYLHLEVPSVIACLACNCGLCASCRRDVLGRTYCEGCLEEKLGAALPSGEALKRPWVATALSFFVPGLGQIYNGLFTRGFAQFLVFFFLGWLTGMLDGVGPVIGIFMVAFWLWQWLDARQMAKNINRTGRLPDMEEARALGALPLPASVAAPLPLGIALILLGVMALMSNFVSAGRVLVPIAVVGIGAWLVWRTRTQHDPGSPPDLR